MGIFDLLKKGFSAVVYGAIVFACSFGVLLQPLECHAEVVEGVAPIVNGDVEKARQDARQDAMRNYVESKVGMAVSSSTTTEMGIVISDRIVTDSRGYVQIKQVISEKSQGDLYVVKLDLDANDTVIETKYKDDAAKLMGAMDIVTDSRRVADIAIISVDVNGMVSNSEAATYAMQSYMGDMNVLATTNTAIFDYLKFNPNSPLTDLRKIAIDNRTEANSILTGRIKDLSVRPVQGGYIASVQAYYMFIGLDNNLTNSFADYFEAAGTTSESALSKARALAGIAAAESLTKSALKIVQAEKIGGIASLNTALEFYNITDKLKQSNVIKSVLASMNCRIVKAGFAPDGVYKMRIVASGFATPGDFSTAFEAKIQAAGMPFVAAEVNSGNPVIAFSM